MTVSHIALLAVLAGTIPITSGMQMEGWATTYGCPGEEYFHGAPLYCDDGVLGLTYRVDLPYWGAVDVGEIQSGNVRCNDRVMACTDKGCALVIIWDAGHLYYDRETGKPWERLRGKKVVLDLPYHVTRALGWTGMDQVTVTNLSRMEREWKRTSILTESRNSIKRSGQLAPNGQSRRSGHTMGRR
jgi:hypothetical protein